MPLDMTPKDLIVPAPGLTFASPDAPGITRRATAKGFAYWDPRGRRIVDRAELDRIAALAIPPAWREVWICPDSNGHLQAVGLDEKGRRQYRYHPQFRAHQDEAKFEHILAFARVLPDLRRRLSDDMAARGLGQRKVLATVVRLLETTLIRVGNSAYAKQNNSYGLTTLQNRHVKVEPGGLRFQFKGKSGKLWRLQLHDRRIARIVKSCQELPGQHLFQYRDEESQVQAVTSSAVNAYLKEISGAEITAKDFRTWTGTVLAALALAELEPPSSLSAAKRHVAEAIRQTAARLGNTPAICRKCYVHPEVIAAYLDGALRLELPQKEDGGLHPEEQAVLAFLKSRLARPEAEGMTGAC